MALNDTRKEKFLGALLSSPTIESAAQVAGISKSTALRTLKEPDFASDYRAARREVVSHSLTALQVACGEAVQTLRDVATDAEAPASSRVSAARSILEVSLRAVEIDDLAARVETLEGLLKDKPNGT